jgi:hypothetical protein
MVMDHVGGGHWVTIKIHVQIAQPMVPQFSVGMVVGCHHIEYLVVRIMKFWGIIKLTTGVIPPYLEDPEVI